MPTALRITRIGFRSTIEPIIAPCLDGVEEADELLVAMASHVAADHRAVEHVKGPPFHADALSRVLAWRSGAFPDANVIATGHRVVHGGVHYDAPVIVTDDVIRELETLVALAPLHELHNIAGIKAACEAWPDVPQIACFDTAFHRSHPFVNDVFALPRKYYDEGLRRYGFHGLSYEYVSTKLRQISPLHAQGRVVVDLGNGASMCAIRDGLSVASSMGFTPLDGLPMGTRCGQLDGAVPNDGADSWPGTRPP